MGDEYAKRSIHMAGRSVQVNSVNKTSNELQAAIQPLAHGNWRSFPPSRRTYPATYLNRWLARMSLVGVGYAIATWTAFVFLRPDLNPLAHYVSEYVNGRYGVLMTATFYGLSLAWAALALDLYRMILPTGRSWFGLGALALCSASSLGAGIFPTDPSGVAPTATGALHWLLATLFFVCICPGMLALAAAWRHDGAWRSRTRVTFVLAGTALAGLIFLMVGPPELSGLAQRWILASVLAWHLLAGWQVNRLAAGRRCSE
jgi:hypothetical membrane protein